MQPAPSLHLILLRRMDGSRRHKILWLGVSFSKSVFEVEIGPLGGSQHLHILRFERKKGDLFSKSRLIILHYVQSPNLSNDVFRPSVSKAIKTVAEFGAALKDLI